MLGYKKGNKKQLSGQIPLHYPGDRVYLDGDTTKNVQDAVDKHEAMIATVQPNLTAVKAYAKGEQFVYNGLLYKVTTAISSGGTITIGGNCELSPSVTEQIFNKVTYKDVTVTFSNLTWTASQQGKYYSSEISLGDIGNKIIVSAVFKDWGSLKVDDYFAPYIESNKLYLMSNKSSFQNTANVIIRVLLLNP